MLRLNIRGRLFKPAWLIHKWIGIIFCIPVIIIAFTGSLLVHYNWIETEFEQHIFREKKAQNYEINSLNHFITRAANDYPNLNPKYIEVPGALDRNVVINFQSENGPWTLIYDSVTGEKLTLREQNKGPRRWLVNLHANLFMGHNGELLVGITSLMLLIASFTGIVIYGKSWLRITRKKWTIKDGHRHIGFINIIMILLISFTGLLLTLGHLLKDDSKPYKKSEYNWSLLPSLEKLLEKALKESNGGIADYMVLPSNNNDPIQIIIFHRNRSWSEKYDHFEFDSTSGELKNSHLGTGDDFLMKLNSLVGALHFGHQGGPLMKWIYFFSGLIQVWLAYSGFNIWKNRRKIKSQSINNS